MNELTDYALAIRTVGSPPPPGGVTSVDLVPGDGDPVAATIGALRASGLTAADFRSRVIFLAPAGPDCLVPYAALCGFAGRRVDAYADGSVLEFSRLGRVSLPDAGRPPGHLMWAQVGGPVVEGLPTVQVTPGEPVAPETVTLIRYAARLRMVPPESARGALSLFMIVAAVRRRTADRFPYLSTGTGPVPVTKDDPDQGIDLELVRREAARYRQELRAGRASPEIVPAAGASPRDRRLADANAVAIREVLRRLGSSADEADRWRCPRPRSHSNGDANPSMKVYGDNRTRCLRCDAEKVGPLRLAIEVLGITPDEAAGFILDSDRAVDMCSG